MESSLSIAGDKSDTHGRADFGTLAGRLQLTSAAIDFIGDDVVAGLVGDHHPFASRVDAEVPGNFDPMALLADRLNLASFLVDREYRNAIVPAVRGVNEFAVWVYDRLGRRILLVWFGNRWECIQNLEF